MPIYEYQCNACGHAFDLMQKMNDPVVRKCPKCAKLKVEKLLSAPSFHLKGTGWYATDYKKTTNDPQKAETKTEAKADKADKKTKDAKALSSSEKTE